MKQDLCADKWYLCTILVYYKCIFFLTPCTNLWSYLENVFQSHTDSWDGLTCADCLGAHPAVLSFSFLSGPGGEDMI